MPTFPAQPSPFIVERNAAAGLAKGVPMNNSSPSLKELGEWLSRGVYNVLAYGEDFQAAASAGAGRELFFPSGRHNLLTTHSLDLTDGTTVRGEAGTVIKAYGSVAATVNLIRVAAGASVTFKDITFEGPDNNNGQTTIGVLHLGTSGTVRFENCKFSGFSTAIKSDAGATSIEVINCEFDGNSLAAHGILHSGTSGRVFALNCDFHDLGASDLDHGIYAGFGNSLDIRSCQFRNIAGYGVHPYSGSGLGTPEYIQVRDCYFYECSMLTSEKANTLVDGCTFNRPTATTTYAIVASGPATIRGCRFEGGGYGISQSTSAASKAGTIIENCVFNTSAIGVSVSAALSTNWKISNNLFTGGGDAGAIGVQVAKEGSAIITGNLFAGEYDYGIRTGAAGKIVARNNKFTCTGMGCMTSATTAYTAEFYDNDFQATGTSIRQYNTDAAVLASGNYLSTTPQTDNATTCQMSARKGIGAAVASANTITLGWNADTYHITGVTDINTIEMDGANGTLMFSGRMNLIMDSTAKITAAGNVIPRTANARTAGEVVSLVHDPVTAKWYEVGW